METYPKWFIYYANPKPCPFKIPNDILSQKTSMSVWQVGRRRILSHVDAIGYGPSSWKVIDGGGSYPSNGMVRRAVENISTEPSDRSSSTWSSIRSRNSTKNTIALSSLLRRFDPGSLSSGLNKEIIVSLVIPSPCWFKTNKRLHCRGLFLHRARTPSVFRPSKNLEKIAAFLVFRSSSRTEALIISLSSIETACSGLVNPAMSSIFDKGSLPATAWIALSSSAASS